MLQYLIFTWSVDAVCSLSFGQGGFKFNGKVGTKNRAQYKQWGICTLQGYIGLQIDLGVIAVDSCAALRFSENLATPPLDSLVLFT